MTRVRALAKAFWQYQVERFPIILLIVIVFPAILSTGAVVVSAAPLGFVLPALIVSIAYMLHLRIIDDYRDYEHDSRHHPERPLIAGAITKRDLAVVDIVAIFALISCSLLANAQATAIAVSSLSNPS